MARQCRASRNLKCSSCNRRHLTVLCDLFRLTDSSTWRSTRQVQAGERVPAVKTHSSEHSGFTSVFLQTVRAWTEGVRLRLLVRVLLDTGSQRTVICQYVARTRKRTVFGTEVLSLVMFGRKKSPKILYKKTLLIATSALHKDSARTIAQHRTLSRANGVARETPKRTTCVHRNTNCATLNISQQAEIARCGLRSRTSA